MVVVSEERSRYVWSNLQQTFSHRRDEFSTKLCLVNNTSSTQVFSTVKLFQSFDLNIVFDWILIIQLKKVGENDVIFKTSARSETFSRPSVKRPGQSLTYFLAQAFKLQSSEVLEMVFFYLSWPGLASSFTVYFIIHPQLIMTLRVSGSCFLLFARARICRPFKESWNRFPAWRNRFPGIDSWAP